MVLSDKGSASGSRRETVTSGVPTYWWKRDGAKGALASRRDGQRRAFSSILANIKLKDPGSWGISMKLEQNIMQYAESGGSSAGYIDIARNLSAVNGKSIAQTKRGKNKKGQRIYKPLGFLIRVRALLGDIIVESLNCGYPTRNSVVLAGHARDEMLKSAGIKRSNLESYQKELRLFFDATMNSGSTQYFPGALDKGTEQGGWGASLTYEYTNLVIERPDTAGLTLQKPLAMLGTQSAASGDWDADSEFYIVDNWLKWRHSFTPSATADGIANNVFSWAIQQSDTSEAIIDYLDDAQDEKPYDLTEFIDTPMRTLVGTDVGNPTSAVFCVPLGLLRVTAAATAIWEIEVVGVTEL